MKVKCKTVYFINNMMLPGNEVEDIASQATYEMVYNSTNGLLTVRSKRTGDELYVPCSQIKGMVPSEPAKARRKSKDDHCQKTPLSAA